MQDGKLHKITVNMKSGLDSSSWVDNCSPFLYSIVNRVTSESKCGRSHKAASDRSTMFAPSIKTGDYSGKWLISR